MDNHEILQMMMSRLLFTPYRWGGDNPVDGFDCSGGIQELLHSVGHGPTSDLTSDDMMMYYSHPQRGTGAINIRFGTLLFFGSNGVATHVSMALNKTMMFEFGGGGSKTQSLQDAMAQKAWGRFRPIARRKDLIRAVDIHDMLPGVNYD